MDGNAAMLPRLFAVRTMSITPASPQDPGQSPGRKRLYALVSQFGYQVKEMFDAVNRTFAAANRVVTNIANSVDGLKRSSREANRALWSKQQETLQAVRFSTDESCRQHVETGKKVESLESEVQKLRALIICAFDQDQEGQY